MVAIAMVAPTKQMVKTKSIFDVKARVKIHRKVWDAVEKNGLELLTNVVRDSPVDTGTYQSMWFLKLTDTTAVIVNNSPQAMRLEFGFVGIDSLGRHYAQAPQPHILPNFYRQHAKFRQDMYKIIGVTGS